MEPIDQQNVTEKDLNPAHFGRKLALKISLICLGSFIVLFLLIMLSDDGPHRFRQNLADTPPKFYLGLLAASVSVILVSGFLGARGGIATLEKGKDSFGRGFRVMYISGLAFWLAAFTPAFVMDFESFEPTPVIAAGVAIAFFNLIPGFVLGIFYSQGIKKARNKVLESQEF